MHRFLAQKFVLAFLALLASASIDASPLSAVGDMRLRHDLQLLADAGSLTIPLTTWPIAWSAIGASLDRIDVARLTAEQFDALTRIRSAVRGATSRQAVTVLPTLAIAGHPRVIRTFENTPRFDAQGGATLSWSNHRFAVNVVGHAVANADDNRVWQPDGSFVTVRLGNWLVALGWQERWWGPGRDGSLILSNNARPVPGISLQRATNRSFESRWLRWIGPWSLTTFMGRLDDERFVDDALLFGVRAGFRPLPSLEVGVSRTAQWCGEQRPCGASPFVDLLLGRDNRGINVDPGDEPGNQLGGVDVRWAGFAGLPVALYTQWIGEDSRRGGPEIGSWLRLAGIEYWGTVGALSHHSHFEVADTSCRAGGLGFSEIDPDCAYGHSIYRTGYRYRGRPIGHGMDGDGLSYSMGTTLVQSAGHSWNASLRYIEINRIGSSEAGHSISTLPLDLIDLQLTHTRATRLGSFDIGVGLSHFRGGEFGNGKDEVSAFLRWRLRNVEETGN